MPRARKVPSCPVRQYADDVLSGKIVAGRLVRLACQRYLNDLKDGPKRGLKWDGAAADRVFQFFGHLRLPSQGELDGKPFNLEPFQKFIIGNLFGWKGEDGNRRFRTAYIEQGKGNGKSPLAAGVGLYGLVADGEASAEIYAAATKLDQAKILFRDAKAMVNASPALRSRLKSDIANISFAKTDSFFRPISSEERGLDGPRPHMGLIDELHEHPNSIVVDKVRAGTKARRQALIFEITNSGYDRTLVCWSHREFSVQVLEGIVENDSWFAYVCQLDPCEACRAEGKTVPTDGCPNCDDWKNEACWEKANPGIDTILPRKYIREQVAEAVGMPAKESIVKRLNFCIWTEASVHAIPMDAWDACAGQVDVEKLKGSDCFLGLDIGATSDFTAAALLFPHDDAEVVELPSGDKDEDAEPLRIVRRSYTILPYFWLPKSPAHRSPQIQAVIDTWIARKLIRVTPGNVVDYDCVLKDLIELEEKYSIRKIAFDRGFQGAWMGTKLMSHFGEHVVHWFPQGIISMNAPFRELIELVKMKRLHHSGDPVARWMASNCAAEIRGGLMKPSKDHSKEKIDFIAAGTMALGVAMQNADANPGDWYLNNQVEFLT